MLAYLQRTISPTDTLLRLKCADPLPEGTLLRTNLETLRVEVDCPQYEMYVVTRGVVGAPGSISAGTPMLVLNLPGEPPTLLAPEAIAPVGPEPVTDPPPAPKFKKGKK